MAFTQSQLEVLKMLLQLTPEQRGKAFQSAIEQKPDDAQNTVDLANSPRRFQTPTRSLSINSDDSSITPSSEEGNNSDSSGGKRRLHTSNRVTRLASKILRDYLNSERVYNHLYGTNNRVVEHKLDNVINQIQKQLSKPERKTQKTHRDMLKKVLKKRMAASRRYRREQKRVGRSLDEAHKSETIDLTKTFDDAADEDGAGNADGAIHDAGNAGGESNDAVDAGREEVKPSPKPKAPKPKKGKNDKPKAPKSSASKPSAPKQSNASAAKEFKARMDNRRNSRKQRKIVARKARGPPKSNKRKSPASSAAKPSSAVPTKKPRTRGKKGAKKSFPFALGTNIARDFEGEVFAGEITKLYPDDHTVCEVTYTDGDKEDMDNDEATFAIDLYAITFPDEE